MQINFPESGYTPRNLNTLLYKAFPDLEARREWLAEKLGVNLDTVHRWCVDMNSKGHVDMPLVRWRQALNLLEADRDVMLSVLQDKILDALRDTNLVYTSGGGLLCLRCFYKGEGDWSIIYEGAALGNAYSGEKNEYFVYIGIDSDGLNWKSEYAESLDARSLDIDVDEFMEKYYEKESYKKLREKFDVKIEASATQRHIEENIKDWANEIMDAIGPKFDNHEAIFD
jgi:hypothetical protein